MVASTIAAVSTPLGSGGIGIIKISGPCAIEIAQSIFVRGSSHTSDAAVHHKPIQGKTELDSHRLVYGHIVDPDTKKIIDEVLFVVMRAPNSYTAEDVVEIQAHASRLVLNSILALLIKNGVVLAAPGEFTRRAFLNGRIDLTQAEAVIDIINARSRKAIGMAIAQISGGFKQIVESLREEIVHVLSIMDAAIDFPDELAETIDLETIVASLNDHTIPQIKTLIAKYEDERFLREGLRIAIMGAPNVGKSSLLNQLVNRERAIVSDIPGTTRDFIEDSFTAKGIPIVVADTAGIHANPDPVERIGIEKAWEHISSADIVLYTVDAGKPTSTVDLDMFGRIAGKKVIIVVNKVDLLENKTFFSFPKQWQGVPHIFISALFGHGITDLKDIIAHLAFDTVDDKDDDLVPNLRHKTALEKILSMLTQALGALRLGASLELAAIDFRSALGVLSEITGETVATDVLDEIFKHFCVGK